LAVVFLQQVEIIVAFLIIKLEIVALLVIITLHKSFDRI